MERTEEELSSADVHSALNSPFLQEHERTSPSPQSLLHRSMRSGQSCCPFVDVVSDSSLDSLVCFGWVFEVCVIEADDAREVAAVDAALDVLDCALVVPDVLEVEIEALV